MKPVIGWLSDEQLRAVYSAAYWNDIQEERGKEWWISDGDYAKCLSYLERTGLLPEYRQAEKYVSALGGNSLQVADLAAGIGWTSALLSRLPGVAEVHAVEISKHRLHELFEHSVKMMEGSEAKISRYLGSFYDLAFSDQSMDVIILSQAFHHADNPLALLTECDRVLKRGGRIILIGEHYIGWQRIARALGRSLIKERKLRLGFGDLFPTDPVLGDHYYRRSDYETMFRVMGYRLRYEKCGHDRAIYVGDKRR